MLLYFQFKWTVLIINKRTYTESKHRKINHLVGWLFGVLSHINLCRLVNDKSIFIQINSSISNKSVKYKYTVQLSKTFLFQTIQFCQTVLIKTINLSISILFIYTQLNVCFRVCTVFMAYQSLWLFNAKSSFIQINNPILNNLVQYKYTF